MSAPRFATGAARLRVGALLLALGMVVAGAPPAWAAHFNFAPPVDYPVGSGPLELVAADLDSDGDIDLASVSVNTDDISILLNNADGTFALTATYTVGNTPQALAAGDLDGDGDLDLAATSPADDVSVLVNNGDGTFAAAQHHTVAVGPTDIVAADLDADGDIDLVTANFASDDVGVLLNNGNGTFAAAVNHPAGDHPEEIVTGDFDGDGDVDLAVTNVLSDDVSVLFNNADGTFALPVNYPVGDQPNGIAAGDLDGDGDLDLVATNALSGDVSVLVNNGNGTFAAPQTYPVGDGPFGVVVADLDGDGDLDVAVATRDAQYVSVLENDGTGTFTGPQNFPVEAGPTHIVAADLDGDADLDLATVNLFSDEVSVLLNTTQADLSVTTTDVPDTVTVGEPLTYIATVANAGPFAAVATTVMDILPEGVDFVSAVSSQGGPCSEADGVVTCPLGTLAADGSATVTITVVPTVLGTIINTATVASAIGDPDPDDNTATVETAVIAAAPPGVPETVTADLPPGGSLTTGTDATSDDPVETTVISPVGGTVSIEETAATTPDPPGIIVLDTSVEITVSGGPADPADPYVLIFRIHESLIPDDVDPADIRPMRDGAPVALCTTPGVADPATCLDGPPQLVGDEVVLRVLTVQASTWTFFVAAPGGGDGDDPYDTYDDDPGAPGFDFDSPFDGAGDPGANLGAAVDVAGAGDTAAADSDAEGSPDVGSGGAGSGGDQSTPGGAEVEPTWLDQLPRTGLNVVVASLAGGILLVLGGGLRVGSRRRRTII